MKNIGQRHGCEQKVTGRIEQMKDMLITTKGNLQSRWQCHSFLFFFWFFLVNELLMGKTTSSLKFLSISFVMKEFNAIKRRCNGLHGHKCMCIVVVKKEERNVKRSVLKSVVGTLDLSIRFLLHGETFPGERVKVPSFSTVSRMHPNQYGYVANLCVAKSARRQGIASNMLHFAIESARSSGIKQVYVHVDKNNIPAQELYQKIGFEMVSVANSQPVEEQTYLLCFKA